MRRVGIFGWGVVAPRSRNIEAFERNLSSSESWLSPFNGFGPDNFLVGMPEFDLADYKPWIDARFPGSRFSQLERKMGQPTQFAIGAFIQSLAQNPGLEQELREYLDELREIEAIGVPEDGDVESAKLAVIKEKRTRNARLQKKWMSPEPPWNAVSSNVLWNIHNTPASQISMMGRITGMTFAPVAACSSFGYGLRLAINAIQLGQAKAVVMGMTDPPPMPLTVGGFYNARVISADASISKPLTALRGTHIAGGSVVWVLGDLEHFTAKGFKPLGMEPIAVGVTADADHIITPSKEGPTLAIREALAAAGCAPEDMGSWDLHATATPGDYLEVQNLRDVLPEQVLITARKGTFGHGMSAGGGWELTAQYLGYGQGKVFPTPLKEAELNKQISRVHGRFVFDEAVEAPAGCAGKLSMGVGGINACVISRPWSK